MGLTKVHTNGKTLLKAGSVIRLRDWPISATSVRERVRYTCPEDVFEHEYVRLVQAVAAVCPQRQSFEGTPIAPSTQSRGHLRSPRCLCSNPAGR